MSVPRSSRPDFVSLLDVYRGVRAATEALCEPLTPEDCVVQSMPEASPIKWHLAHTSWFFETFILRKHAAGYAPLDRRYEVLFNSYYNGIGAQHPRPQRGLLSRPTVAEVLAYRRHVDAAMTALLEAASAHLATRLQPIVELGLNHEEQHQELILTDLKHLLSLNPLLPVYRAGAVSDAAPLPLDWRAHTGGTVFLGHAGREFAFDNESPRHQVLLRPFEIATRLTTNSEYLAFMDDGGYERPELWLSDGWEASRRLGWKSPLYWRQHDGEWNLFTLAGERRLIAAEPVCHVSFYEADAFARWNGARLPLEAEWETAASDTSLRGNLLESGALHPVPLAERPAKPGIAQLFGDVWEWTASPYVAYPGYEPPPGAIGEYNGKFMCNQMVLRGASCATPGRHVRSTYRNFFPPEARWQFSGIRLAR